MSRSKLTSFSRLMQLILISILGLGVLIGDTKVIVNSAVSLLITFLPAILDKRYDITLDPLLSLWITSAVFLHAVGAVNLIGTNFYSSFNWWDHMTHTLSSSVVAAAGYITLRAFDEYYEELHFPRKLLFVFILIFVMAFGVIWELLEFGIAGLADILGTEKVLTQYGLEDTMKDLIFDSLGAVLVALLGEAHLNSTVNQIRQKIEKRTGIDISLDN